MDQLPSCRLGVVLPSQPTASEGSRPLESWPPAPEGRVGRCFQLLTILEQCTRAELWAGARQARLLRSVPSAVPSPQHCLAPLGSRVVFSTIVFPHLFPLHCPTVGVCSCDMGGHICPPCTPYLTLSLHLPCAPCQYCNHMPHKLMLWTPPWFGHPHMLHARSHLGVPGVSPSVARTTQRLLFCSRQTPDLHFSAIRPSTHGHLRSHFLHSSVVL